MLSGTVRKLVKLHYAYIIQIFKRSWFQDSSQPIQFDFLFIVHFPIEACFSAYKCLKPLIMVDRIPYLDSYHVPYGICYIMPLFSYFNLIFYRKVLNIKHFSIFSMVWMFFICMFRFFFLRLKTYAKQVFNIPLDQGKSKFVM